MNKSIFIFVILLFVSIGCQTNNNIELKKDVITKEQQTALTPDKVLENLKAGNKRFTEGKLTAVDYHAQIKATTKHQYPEAVILSCIDSRVPVEIVFDKGIGDIFVGRVAGNIENEDMLGSIEYGTAVAGSKVLVVLGHQNCGAVKGAVDYVAIKELGMNNLNHLLEGINPAVEVSLIEGEERSSKNKELVKRSVKENVKLTIERIKEKSEKLKTLEADGKIKIVGGIYDLSSGKIEWL